MSAAPARPRIRGLYAITPDSDDTDRLLARVAAALEGGARLLQYRNKSASRAVKLEQARALKAVCAAHGAALIVNDDVDIAAEIGADGVHVGAEDASINDARAALGTERIVGASCYRNLELALTAQRAGADYVAFGSFFPSRVKPGAVRASLELLAAAKGVLAVPIVAIGGITPENAPPLVAAGADALAVITAVFDASDPRAAAAQFGALYTP